MGLKMNNKHMQTENTERRLSFEGLTVERGADDASKLSGYAVVFDEATTIGGKFTESVKRGAFDSVDMSNTFALFNHDWDKPLGKMGKNLDLTVDERGLKFDLTLPNTTYANDLAENIRTGLVEGCSFGFTIDEDSWTRSEGLPNRVIERVGELFEVTLTHIPAYPTTEVAMRSLESTEDVPEGALEPLEAPEAVEEVSEEVEVVEEAPEELETPKEEEEEAEKADESAEEDEERTSKEELMEMKLAKKNGKEEAPEEQEKPQESPKPEPKAKKQAKHTKSAAKRSENTPNMENNLNADAASEIRSNTPVDSVEGQAGNFDFSKLVRGLAKGQLSGLEAEIAQEGAAEARAAGVQTSKGVSIPEAIIRTSSSNLIGSNNWGGGAAPATQKFNEMNVAGDIAAQLGIERLTGLSGNVLLPFIDKNFVSAQNEGATIANTTSPFGTATLSPQRFSGRVDVSGQLIAQSSVNLDGFLKNALLRDVDEAFSTYIASKILANDDDVATDEDAFDLEARMLANNITPANIGVVAGTTAFRDTRDQGIGLGGANLVVGQSPASRNSILDYTTCVSSQVAAAQMTMLDRSGFMAAEWGGVNVVVDNMTLAADDMYRVILNTYKDFQRCKANAAFTVTTYGTANA